MTGGDKSAFRITAIIVLVLALLGGGYYWFFVRSNDDERLMTVDEFKVFASTHLPAGADVAPFEVGEYPQPKDMSCVVQQKLIPHGLAAGGVENLSLRLFDSHDAAVKFVSNMPACWIETGNTTIENTEHVNRNGVDIYIMTLGPNAGGSNEVYAAVYRNVYMFTFTSLSTKWQPWESVASGIIKEAIDKSLA